MKKIIIAAALTLAFGQVMAQQNANRNYPREGLSQEDINRREAWLNSAEYKQSQQTVNAVPPVIANQAPVAVTVAASPAPVALAVQQPSARAAEVPVPAQAVKETSGSQGGVLVGTPQSGSSVKASADGQAKAGSAAAEPGNAAKEAEIRERIKAVTTNGQGGRR